MSHVFHVLLCILMLRTDQVGREGGREGGGREEGYVPQVNYHSELSCIDYNLNFDYPTGKSNTFTPTTP